ncbi:MAG: protein kinase [Ignavibacteriae bacterium]|nr:hypothetical protein [Ignavibacteriota bacterium]NOG97063.1 protein kinase [Ignavibacteriota bacterium]
MDYESKWYIEKELGSGGQGKVFLVVDREALQSNKNKLLKVIRDITPVNSYENNDNLIKHFRSEIKKLIEIEYEAPKGALKVLHKPEVARANKLAYIRIKDEMQAMKKLDHNNLLKLLDADISGKWFVSEYHSGGTLGDNISRFKGNIVQSIKYFKPLVEGVAMMHMNKLVHRDIKPQNIFISKSDELILGDMGLVYFSDADKTRISNEFENVGSRDWMPAWAMGVKIDEVNPSFDVFTLGKTLWSMISGLPVLRLWYIEEDQFNLEKIFQDKYQMKLVNKFFKKVIVEREKQCLPNALEMLYELEELVYKMENGSEILSMDITRRCKVCGIGHYNCISDNNSSSTSNFGLNNVGTRKFRIFSCSDCGHVQLFTHENDYEIKAWE